VSLAVRQDAVHRRLARLDQVRVDAKQQHLADAAAALDVTLSDDEARALEEHYTPRQPTGY
jgi:hypothetical protein